MLTPSREDYPLRTAGGAIRTGVYDLRVAILDDNGDWGRPAAIAAPHIASPGDAYQATIGRDVLSLGDLMLERSGSYSFAF